MNDGSIRNREGKIIGGWTGLGSVTPQEKLSPVTINRMTGNATERAVSRGTATSGCASCATVELLPLHVGDSMNCFYTIGLPKLPSTQCIRQERFVLQKPNLNKLRVGRYRPHREYTLRWSARR